MIQTIKRLLVVFMLFTPFAQADLLPSPTNLSIEGDVLTWDEVEGATGYNIYLGFGYFDTVKGSTQYKLSQSGSYWVVAFDDAGNYGSQYGNDATVEYAGAGDSVTVNTSFYSSIVQTTCQNVGPGESCVASCTSTSTILEPAKFTRYLSGGGCSTSDIVEADAFIGRFTYQCTVPTFSGEVVAQAICVHR